MTGDGLPPAGRPGADTNPELRVSDEDRDRVVEIIRVAAGDGRLSATELDDRPDAALTACTIGELAALTVDLPDVAAHVGGITLCSSEAVSCRA
jgi:hypothetical protein